MFKVISGKTDAYAYAFDLQLTTCNLKLTEKTMNPLEF
jgi:hypothetical protein